MNREGAKCATCNLIGTDIVFHALFGRRESFQLRDCRVAQTAPRNDICSDLSFFVSFVLFLVKFSALLRVRGIFAVIIRLKTYMFALLRTSSSELRTILFVNFVSFVVKRSALLRVLGVFAVIIRLKTYKFALLRTSSSELRTIISLASFLSQSFFYN